ncbi:MAG TPA: hypothetical protein PKA82_00265 [Pyrinomonadaceae bacterium]|nr:hypothetical protein [Pyrinomonadaceae bacterium]
MRQHTFRTLVLIALALSFSAVAASQITKPTGGKINSIVITDSDFGTASSSKPSPRGFIYEVWITTDGVLHCRTGERIKSATIKFTFPTASSTDGGTTTSSGGDTSRKLVLKPVSKIDVDPSSKFEEYFSDISADKYKTKHAVTVTLTSVSGKTVEVKLVNKKVPATIG